MLQVRTSDKTPLLSCLLEGPGGSGKSALAATQALASEFPFVKVLGPETLVGYMEQAKASQITRVSAVLLCHLTAGAGAAAWGDLHMCAADAPDLGEAAL